MNLPNKLTVFRIFITIFIIIILLFPFHAIGISSIKLFINESIVVSLKYIIAGVLFIIGCLTDFVDGYIARKYNMVTELGKIALDNLTADSDLKALSKMGSVSVNYREKPRFTKIVARANVGKVKNALEKNTIEKLINSG